MKEVAKGALLHRMRATEDNDAHKAKKLTIYCQTINNLLEAYATDDFIGEAKADIMYNQKPGKTSAFRYSETFWESHYDMDGSATNHYWRVFSYDDYTTRLASQLEFNGPPTKLSPNRTWHATVHCSLGYNEVQTLSA